MSAFTLSLAQAADVPEIWKLNQSEVPHVGDITLTHMESHFKNSARFTVVRPADSAEIVGFLLAFDEKATYKSLNFLWFQARYPNFVYVDRLAVAPAFRKFGIGRMLYADAEAFALPRTRRVTCEVNIKPPNDVSSRFHRGIGFEEVGILETDGGKKSVSLLLKSL